jgi:hypothetical protein
MPGGFWGAVFTALLLPTFAAAAALWCLFNIGRISDGAVRLARAAGLVRPRPPAPLGMPIERIAADLRRIRVQAQRPVPGTPMARRRGIVSAYDDALVDACRALGVATALDQMSDGFERESERLRTEHALEHAGVDLR